MLSYVALDVTKQGSGRERIATIMNKPWHGCRHSICPVVVPEPQYFTFKLAPFITLSLYFSVPIYP